VLFLLSTCFCALRMMTVAFTLNSCIRGYHVYKDIWDPPISEIVVCQRKNRNPRDPYMVALWKDSITVGHVPHMISCICMLFLRHGGVIRSTVTGPRRYSDDFCHVRTNLLSQKILQRRLVNCYLTNWTESVNCKVRMFIVAIY